MNEVTKHSWLPFTNMGGGGFLLHMQKALEYNRSLLRKKTPFTKSFGQNKGNKPIHVYPKATEAIRERFRSKAIENKKRETSKLAMITLVVLIIILLVLNHILSFL